MTPVQRAVFKKQLLALEHQLAGKAPRKLDPNRTDVARAGGDEDEQPLNEMEQAVASNRNKNDAAVLGRVRAALARVAGDAFGECLECGEPIRAGRLKAMPYVERCLECQGKRDAFKGGPTRKRLNDFVE